MPAMVAWLAAPIIRISFERWIRRAKKERQHQSATTAWTIEVVKNKKEPLIEFIGGMTALPVILNLFCSNDSRSRWWPFGADKSFYYCEQFFWVIRWLWQEANIIITSTLSGWNCYEVCIKHKRLNNDLRSLKLYAHFYAYLLKLISRLESFVSF